MDICGLPSQVIDFLHVDALYHQSAKFNAPAHEGWAVTELMVPPARSSLKMPGTRSNDVFR